MAHPFRVVSHAAQEESMLHLPKSDLADVQRSLATSTRDMDRVMQNLRRLQVPRGALRYAEGLAMVDHGGPTMVDQPWWTNNHG